MWWSYVCEYEYCCKYACLVFVNSMHDALHVKETSTQKFKSNRYGIVNAHACTQACHILKIKCTRLVVPAISSSYCSKFICFDFLKKKSFKCSESQTKSVAPKRRMKLNTNRNMWMRACVCFGRKLGRVIMDHCERSRDAAAPVHATYFIHAALYLCSYHAFLCTYINMYVNIIGSDFAAFDYFCLCRGLLTHASKPAQAIIMRRRRTVAWK